MYYLPHSRYGVKVELKGLPIIKNEKDLYSLVKNALENNMNTVYISKNSININHPMYRDTILLVLEHHPELDYLWKKSLFRYGYDGEKYFIKFNYIDNFQEMKKQVNIKAKQIISQIIEPGMTDLEKAKAIHDYIVLNTKYDYENFLKNTVPQESYTAYGVLVKGTGVCQGYTAAFNLLANMSGIKSIGIAGKTVKSQEKHMWNMVNINGQIRYIDATWDDPVPDIPGRVRYDYFNISAQELAKTHIWNQQKHLQYLFD